MVNDRRTALTKLDWILVWLALILTGSLIAMPFSVAPMFAGLVAGRDPPLLTRLALASWFPPLLALPPAALLVAARRATASRRRLIIALAAAVALIATSICLSGLSASTLQPPRGNGRRAAEPAIHSSRESVRVGSDGVAPFWPTATLNEAIASLPVGG